jgi:hypothetical protein
MSRLSAKDWACYCGSGRAREQFESIKEAAVRIGRVQISSGESFCFRLPKRGAHFLEGDTSTLEQKIDGAIWTALSEKHGA